MRWFWLFFVTLGVLGCTGGDVSQPKAGDVLTPSILVAPVWKADIGGMITLQFRLSGNGRAEPAILPGDQLPAGSNITATMRFLNAEGQPVGTVLRPEFEADC